jgi:hypothetical protein
MHLNFLILKHLINFYLQEIDQISDEANYFRFDNLF